MAKALSLSVLATLLPAAQALTLGVRGAPTHKSWPKGLVLARGMSFEFPAFKPTPLAKLVPNASKEGLIEVVKACPSGALRYSLPGEAPQQLQPETKGVVIEKDGPYRVCGIPLEGAPLATGANATKYVLCRCGASKNKPYCDGSHYDIGWKAS